MSALDLITEHLDVWTGAQVQKTTGRGKSTNDQSIYGIKKLRELILELAMRGKLVEQDPNDEPASELLKSIAKEKTRLLGSGKIRQQKTLLEVQDDEQFLDIPTNWIWTRLGIITQINPRNTVDDDQLVSFVPMPLISTSHTGEHGQEQRYWSEVKKGYTHFADGDIGLAKITPCFENSKAVVFSQLRNGIGAGTTELHIARPFDNTLNARFILLYLKSPQFLSIGQTKMTGTAGQKRVPKDFFAGNPLPLPPLAEQHRIVAKVDELMALCDQLEQQQTNSNATHQTLVETLLAALTRPASTADGTESTAIELFFQHFDTLFTTEQSIDHLKQTILQLAVMGKLVPQDKQVMTSSLINLNEKVNRERQQALMPKNTGRFEVSIFESSKLKFIVPENWEIGPLANLALAIVDCPHSTPKWSDEGEICVRTNQLNPGLLDLSISRYVSLETYQKRVERLVPQGGDVLYSREGGILGVACIIPPGVKLCLGQRIMLIRPPSFVESRYLEMILNSPFISAIAREFTTGGAAPRVNLTTVKAYPIPLPPIEEQHRIVAKVDELMALCDALKAQFSGARATQFNLANTIGKQATA